MTQPIIWDATGKRPFACSPAAIQAILVDQQERILLLNNPHRRGLWQVVSGALEAQETLLEAALRETGEEAGPAVQVRPLGVVHAQSFHYDEAVRYMISIHYLMAYHGGPIEPGDDMAGSHHRWWSLAEIETEQPALHPSVLPLDLLKRTIELYRLWQTETVSLQTPLQ